MKPLHTNPLYTYDASYLGIGLVDYDVFASFDMCFAFKNGFLRLDVFKCGIKMEINNSGTVNIQTHTHTQQPSHSHFNLFGTTGINIRMPSSFKCISHSVLFLCHSFRTVEIICKFSLTSSMQYSKRK